MKPELKQFGALTQEDFQRFPVWVNVHVFDYDEPWYDETDEDTFRPWLGQFPVDPSLGIFLVRSQMVLNDGTMFTGLITPVLGEGEVTDSEIGSSQPFLFVQVNSLITFWGGVLGFTDEAKRKTYELLGRNDEKIFPIRFSAESGLTKGKQVGKIRGFYKMIDFKSRKVEVSV